MRFKFTLMLCWLSSAWLYAQTPAYRDPQKPIEVRVRDLLSRMTLQEKVLQLNQYTFGKNTNANNIGALIDDIPAGIGSLIYFGDDPQIRNLVQAKAVKQTRLGIPILFGYDVIHGFRTIYPISLAQACSWNPALVTAACSMAAKEAKLSGVDWTFSPMIDVARDPRWGRIAEGYGEDTYANSAFGVASIKGYQGTHLSDEFSIAACLKHYVAYGRSEGGRDYHYTDVSMQALWETYLPPFEAGVKAGAATLMSSFNDISGIPATANRYMLKEVLKQRWKHDGFVVSDWNAIGQLIDQGVAANRKEAGLKAFNAGVDMDMKDDIYREYLQQLLAEKKVTMLQINEAVARILRVKFRLGLFEKPFAPVLPDNKRYLLPESRTIARNLAAESMVLLKNNKAVLPLKSGIKKIALVGPMANDKINLLGAWSYHGQPNDVCSLLEGMQQQFNGTQITYAKGCDFDGDDESGFAEAAKAAQDADVVVICLGENKQWSGENASRSNISLPRVQEKLVEHLKLSGKPIVLVLANGRPLELIRIEPLADAILEIWQPGVEGGAAASAILSGAINPSGKLAVTFPLTTGQIPVYYSMRQSARPDQGRYQDIPTTPLYWFGDGLSYAPFKYGAVTLSSLTIKPGQKIVARVDVANTGNMDGKEVVFWYVAHPAGNISRPLKELVFFEKKEIRQGATATYQFEIDPLKHLGYPDANGKVHLQPGVYSLMVNNQKVSFRLLP
ncbi:glycoside hydrolase family 3 N-terminal domain-containing protein [Mucilaginibacter sp. PAMB04274]|uniref:glycoside hydrolase family 3 N-terminal domain-containing protein n=1 Tax=Mucilaginibacter sp. PAMB04274 TaxID=3138568 RepID=UPI0031F69C18